ncbi:ROK family protein [Ornithinimicrobium sp. F0845]|uniref:ROK family transcriptional regulator n=1 Tax=Ornithinimicrobium sp. F0845 TaxID=2926412 RepID=UPI001FF2FFF6|nr:ROK family protein [Ornithinimicrobium sp. F0845]MCK0112571.1 ROK family protein [Ornithinimicrobium sp. F0845]
MTQVTGRPRGGRRPVGKVLPGDARRHHRALVLQQLFDDGPRSRADLSRETGLTRVTVSDLVAELLDTGMLVELGHRPGVRQGKPATLVGLADTAPVVVALDLSGDRILRSAVVDLHGGILTAESVELSEGEAAVAEVLALVARLREQLTRPVLGVGIGAPGIIDHAGTVLHAPNLGWSDLALAERVHRETGLPAYVANDANMATAAETSFGAGDDAGLLLVTIGHGVGGGVLVDGRVLAGPLLSSGEIGHVVVDPDGPTCACGNRGCLETILAVPTLRRAQTEAELVAAGQRLGSVLSPVVTTLGIADVVLYGPAELLDGHLLRATQDALAHQTLPFVARQVHVRVVPLADELVLKGAAALVRYREIGVV